MKKWYSFISICAFNAILRKVTESFSKPQLSNVLKEMPWCCSEGWNQLDELYSHNSQIIDRYVQYMHTSRTWLQGATFFPPLPAFPPKSGLDILNATPYTRQFCNSATCNAISDREPMLCRKLFVKNLWTWQTFHPADIFHSHSFLSCYMVWYISKENISVIKRGVLNFFSKCPRTCNMTSKDWYNGQKHFFIYIFKKSCDDACICD